MDISIARKHVEMLYLDRCDIIEHIDVVEDGITYKKEAVTASDVPCKLSHVRQMVTGDEVAPSTSLTSKLMISPEIKIKAGSKIIVYRNGVSTYYECSSEPAIFHNHQEIWIELLEGYA